MWLVFYTPWTFTKQSHCIYYWYLMWKHQNIALKILQTQNLILYSRLNESDYACFKNSQMMCMWFRAPILHFCHRIDNIHTGNFKVSVLGVVHNVLIKFWFNHRQGHAWEFGCFRGGVISRCHLHGWHRFF